MAAAERIFMFLDLPKEPTGKRPVPEIRGEIEFRDVWFAYNEFGLGKGSPSLAPLEQERPRPNRGQILIDGVPLEELDLGEYRRACGKTFACGAVA